MALLPEDIQAIKDLIKADIAKPTEPWSWSKFLLGVFNGRNYAKAIIIGICMIVILVIVFSVGSVIKSHFGKSSPAPIATAQTVGTNQGQIQTSNESHDNHDSGGGFTIINLSKWFSSKK